MKLKALDQLHVSSAQPDSLKPGQVFTVSKALGEALLKAHPKGVEVVEDEPDAKPEAEAKAEDPHPNKAEPAPANKAETSRKTK